jgi:hypothetical protein
MRKLQLFFPLIIFTALAVSACGKPANPAVKAVESYLNALVNKDSNSLSALSCADWESNALLELDSLQAVTTKMENLVCTATGTNGSITNVNCQGKILATYNGEDQKFDLSVRTYQVVNQGGEYLVCGYQ